MEAVPVTSALLWFRTPRRAILVISLNIPVGRLGQAEEITKDVLYLANDAAAFNTCATLTLNGGQFIPG